MDSVSSVANEFDTRLVDTILVFIALFISVLTAFIIDALKEFQPDPADITNQLLLAIHTRLTNTSAPIIDANEFFTLDHTQRSNAIFANALLLTSLSISIIISVLATTTKLWLLRYSRAVAAPGPPFKRAINRQEVYSGLLAWKAEAIIESLPVLVVIAVIFIHSSIVQEEIDLCYFVGALLSLGLVFLLLASMSASFIPSSPFQSAFSDIIRSIFSIFPNYPLTEGEAKRKAKGNTSPTIIRTVGISLFCVGVACVTAYLTQTTGSYTPSSTIFFIAITILTRHLYS